MTLHHVHKQTHRNSGVGTGQKSKPNTLCSKDYQLKDTLCDIEVNDARTDVKCNMNKTFLINQQPQFKLANE